MGIKLADPIRDKIFSEIEEAVEATVGGRQLTPSERLLILIIMELRDVKNELTSIKERIK